MPVNELDRKNMRAVKLELEIEINDSIENVWKALVTDTTKWWPKDFYTSPNTKSFNIEPKLGGWMYEMQADGGGLIWMTVQGLRPPNYLYLVGHISPPFGGPATSLLTIELVEKGKKVTTFKLQDNCFGQLGDNMQKSLDDGWKYLFENCMKAYIEN